MRKRTYILFVCFLLLCLPFLFGQGGWEGQYFQEHTDQEKTVPTDGQIYKWDDAQKLWVLGTVTGLETDPLSATKALNNLASVAINLSLTSDTAATDDLGTEAIYWKKLYLGSDISFEGATDDAYQTTLTAVDTTLSDKSINIPNASGTMAVSATAPATLSVLGDIGITVLKDLVTTAPLTGGTNDILVGADADITIAIPAAATGADGYLTSTDWNTFNGKMAGTLAKDIVAGVGLSGGEDNVLPGADADTTLTFDATELGDLTFGAGVPATMAWTFSLSGASDPTLTFGNSSLTLVGVLTSDGLTLGNNENLTFGTETLTFDAITSNDFELSDDLNINDTDPHLKLVPTTGDAFEMYAFGNEWYFTNVTDATVLWKVTTGNLINFYNLTGYNFPNTAPADNQIWKYDAALGRMAWEADATGAGYAIYIEEGDVAKANNTAADLYVDFDATDFETAVVGNEVNVTIPDDGHAHTTTSISGIDISADTNLAVTAPVVLTDDTLSLTIAKDIVAGVGLSGGEDNVLPGADADTTLTFDATELESVTWGGGAQASIVHTFAVSGTDTTMTYGNGTLTLLGTFISDGLTVGNNENLTFGAETITFDGAGTNDFEFSDDITINDTTPHLRLTDTTASEDDFEIYTDASQFVLTNATDLTDILYVTSTNTIRLLRNTTVPDLTVTGKLTDGTNTTSISELAVALQNIELISLREITQEGLAYYNLINSWVDTFTDETGINTGASTNQSFSAGYYTPSVLYISNADLDDEDMADITDWTDSDSGTGDSSQATFDSKSCMKLATVAVSGTAKRTQDIGTFGTRTVISFNTYFDAIGTKANNDNARIEAYDGTTQLICLFASDGLYVYDGASYVQIDANIVVQDIWQEWTLDINWTTKTVNIYLDGILKHSDVDCSHAAAGTNGEIEFYQYGNTTANRITYIDWFKAGSNITSNPSNMTLISNSFTATATPTKARLVMIAEPIDSITINTDLKGWMSRDNGTTYTQLTLSNVGVYSGALNIYASDAVDISGQPSGTSMVAKATTLNNKSIKIHAHAPSWGN